MKSTSPFPNSNGHSTPGSATPRQAPEGNGTPPADAPSPDTSHKDKGDRDSRGRFVAGNKGGPGNPFARRTAALRQAMLDAVTPEDVQAIVRQMIQKAREGDVAAARLVLAYAVGKPDRAVDPDTLDVHEFQLWQQNAVASQDLAGVVGRMQAGLANEIVRLAVPEVQEATADNLGQAMLDSLPKVAPESDPPVSRTPQQGSDASPSPAASGPKRDRDVRKRNRPEAGSGDAEADALPEELYRELEREARLDFLQEVARRILDSQRPEMTVGQPQPSPNGFYPCRST